MVEYRGVPGEATVKPSDPREGEDCRSCRCGAGCAWGLSGMSSRSSHIFCSIWTFSCLTLDHCHNLGASLLFSRSSKIARIIVNSDDGRCTFWSSSGTRTLLWAENSSEGIFKTCKVTRSGAWKGILSGYHDLHWNTKRWWKLAELLQGSALWNHWDAPSTISHYGVTHFGGRVLCFEYLTLRKTADTKQHSCSS